MNFKPNYSIYLQVADFICEKVLTGVWRDGDKLPAVKDLAVLTSVNPNTVIKALTWLQDNDILNTQRGVGYFLSDIASSKTLALDDSSSKKICRTYSPACSCWAWESMNSQSSIRTTESRPRSASL